MIGVASHGGCAAGHVQERQSRSIGLERFHVLGWQYCLDHCSLVRLRTTSNEFWREVTPHLLASLQMSLRKEDCKPMRSRYRDADLSSQRTTASSRSLCQAIEALLHLAPAGDAASIQAVAVLLAHANQAVRKAALVALRRLAPRGDSCALAVITSLPKYSEECRCTALRALGWLASRGDEEAVYKVVSGLEDDQLVVRMAAVDALRCLVDKGNRSAIAKVIERCRHDNAGVREAALIVLNHLSDKGDEAVIDMVRQGLEANTPAVRCTAVCALERLSPREHSGVITLLSLQLASDDDVKVRVACAQVLGAVAAPGSRLVQNSILVGLKDSAATVRAAAVCTLEKTLAADGSSEESPAIQALASMTKDISPIVRAVAVVILGRVCGGCGNGHMEVAACLEDECELVRAAATEAAAQLVKKGSIPMITTMLGLVQHHDENVRQATNVALERLPAKYGWIKEKQWHPNEVPEGLYPRSQVQLVRHGRRKLAGSMVYT